MEIILLEHIAKLGKMGDKVNVKSGYARNYLLPQKKALRATEANVAYFEKQRAELEAHNKALFDEANKKAEQLKGFSAVLVRQAAETGQLYGSVTIRDIAAAINESGVALERRFVSLDKPIKYLGIYPVKLSLHPEVSQTILVNVARSQDEAKKQAKAYNNETTAVAKEETVVEAKAEEAKAETKSKSKAKAKVEAEAKAEEAPAEAPKKRGRPKKSAE
jgi:large subunit ribosomal protein L9